VNNHLAIANNIMKFLISVLLLVVPVWGAMYVSGPLDGLTCDSEAVQSTIAGQFNTILSELTNTTFFRLVRVEGEGYCPIDSLRTDTTGGAPTCGQVDDTFASYSSPAASSVDPFSGGAFGSSTSSSAFGGGDQAHAEEGGLCSVEPEKNFQESAEKIITSISPEEIKAQNEFPRDNDCVIEGTFHIRPDYWLDICDTTSSSDYEYVNLKLNPERNTGYDGKVIWDYMHTTIGALDTPEGHILQRLISGYHAATTTEIMHSFYPPSRKDIGSSNNGNGGKSTAWKPNFKKFALYATEERVKNMQFAFVLIARSVFKIKDYLYEYPYTTGNSTTDQNTKKLMDHLLDTSVLSTCDSVFSGFDESTMFANVGNLTNNEQDKHEFAMKVPKFKKAFRQIQNAVNCVTCHRCKLHAQVAIHGIGVAIKILLTSQPELIFSTLTRDDIVALVNALFKVSESISFSNELMSQYYSELATSATSSASTAAVQPVASSQDHKKITGPVLQFIAENRQNLTRVQEDALVNALMSGHSEVLMLAEYFSGWAFVRHALVQLDLEMPDAVVVGGGLAGLVTAVAVADRGGSVVILEKQPSLGGNSAKASSGINSIPSNASSTPAPAPAQEESSSTAAAAGGGGGAGYNEWEMFYADTVKSQNGCGNEALARILVTSANASVTWLGEVTGIDLDSSRTAQVGQLGGHTRPRTHRPANGVVGAEIMAALIKQVADRHPFIQVKTRSTVKTLLRENGNTVGEGEGEGAGAVIGVEYESVSKGGDVTHHVQHARSTVLASGGFGYDAPGLLKTYRPDLVSFPTTLGAHTTGEGIRMATSVGAELVDMQYVQLHPTGFIDPRDRTAHTKVLGAEIMRGIGGIILSKDTGDRFVNELDTRKNVCDRMLADSKNHGRERGEGGAEGSFWIVIGEHSHKLEERLLNIYMKRNLLRNVSRSELIEAVGPNVMEALKTYSDPDTEDKFGRQLKRGLPLDDCGYWLLGEVTPVV
jgi:succinate dehydrogenase/fumarate reductase flavoprotein subunit